MMSSPSPISGAQDLHENLLCIGDAAFLNYQIKTNWTELNFNHATTWQHLCKKIQQISLIGASDNQKGFTEFDLFPCYVEGEDGSGIWISARL